MKMKLKAVLCLLIMCILSSCGTEKQNTADINKSESEISISVSENENHTEKSDLSLAEESEVSELDIVRIGKDEFKVIYEENDTAEKFLELLPLSVEMQELNGNEKYIYLETALPSDPQNVGQINAGDIMLYGDSCIVIFYESFTTSYSYTKIGHIENAENLKTAIGNGSIGVNFEKA